MNKSRMISKIQLIVILLGTFLQVACDYRMFDLVQYPELQADIPGGNFGSKITESNFDSIFATVIQSKCINCHKPGGKAEEIPLTSYKDIMSATDELGALIVVPGKPQESLFYTVLLPGAPRIMPPKRSELGAVEFERTEAIRAWIEAGALEVNPTK